MRKMKKWIALLLVACMMMSMGISAFAEEGIEEQSDIIYQVKINGGNGWVQFENDGEGHVGQSLESEFGVTSGKSLSTDRNVIVSGAYRDGFTFDGWAIASYDGLNVDTTLPQIDSAAVSNYPITSNIAFVAQWIENNDGNNNGNTETGSDVSVEVVGNDGVFDFEEVSPSGPYTVTGQDEFSIVIKSGKCLADYEYSFFNERQDGHRFLGWDIYVIREGEWVKLDGFNDIATDTMLDYPINEATRFVAQWEEKTPGSETEGNYVQIQIDGSEGSFTVKHPADSNTPDDNTQNFGTNIEDGSSLDAAGYIIGDPVFWAPDREFDGWMIGTLGEVSDDMGNTYWDFIPFDGTGLMTTAQMLTYKITDDYDQIVFKAQWAGEDSKYYGDVFLDGYYGEFEFIEDTPMGQETIKTDNWGCGLKKGFTVFEQIGFELTKEPSREGYTFEGWLEFRFGEPFELVSRTIYTTDQILKQKKVPADYTPVYTAKWKEISIEEYIENVQRPGVEENFIMDANGGQIEAELVMQNGEKQNSIETNFAFSVPANVALKDFFVGEGVSEYSFIPVKENAEFTGWTVYAAKYIEVVEVEEGETITPEDSKTKYMYAESEDGYDFYIKFVECELLEASLPGEALLEVSSNMIIYAVANWKTVDIKDNEADDKLVLDIQNEVKIPEAVKDKYDSVDDVKDALKDAVLKNDKIDSGKANVVFMEIVLKLQKADGTFEEVTEENFPEEGIVVVIPYPEGTNKNDFDFVVSHLISSGEKAGQIEILNAEKKDNGLHVHVYSLSPFAVAYQEAEEIATESDTTIESESKTETNIPTDSPNTGDATSMSMIILMISVMMLSVAAMAVVFVYSRRRK